MGFLFSSLGQPAVSTRKDGKRNGLLAVSLDSKVLTIACHSALTAPSGFGGGNSWVTMSEWAGFLGFAWPKTVDLAPLTHKLITNNKASENPFFMGHL
jgi:hypothetical protein